MNITTFLACSSVLAMTLPAGIARAKDDAFQAVQRSVQERTGKGVRWEDDQAAREQALQQVGQLIRKPLTVDTAVQIALLNNRSLQAAFEQIGLSAAEVLEAATIPNPKIDMSVRFPDKPPSGTYVDYSAALDFLSILMIPPKKRVAKDQLEATVLRVADETLELVSKLKSTFYSLQASQQLLHQLKLIVDTSAASLDLAQRQHEAGNITDLALAQHEVPSSEVPMSGLERLAISQRLDLQAAYLQVTSQAKNLGLTKDFRLMGALDFGIESERETDSQTRTGPTFAIELPIFNQGQARIARGEAALRQAQDKFEALAIDVRSQIRELRDALASKRGIALFYQDELLPDQRRILSESLLNYNAMAIGNYELFATKAEEARTERAYVEAVRDYWIARAELERAVGGNLNPRVFTGDKAVTKRVSNRATAKASKKN
jgi:cobalt-zinc-cadmium efflux system outer membrane protein